MIFLFYVDGMCGFRIFNPAYYSYLWLKLQLVSSVIFILLEYVEFPICAIAAVNCEFVVCRPAQCINFRLVIH